MATIHKNPNTKCDLNLDKSLKLMFNALNLVQFLKLFQHPTQLLVFSIFYLLIKALEMNKTSNIPIRSGKSGFNKLKFEA